MNTEQNDPILDACLEEVLGGHAPPDLTEQILQRHQARLKAAGGHCTGPPIAGPPVAVDGAGGRVVRRRRQTFWRQRLVSAAVVAAVLFVGVSVSLVAWDLSSRPTAPGGDVVQSPAPEPPPSETAPPPAKEQQDPPIAPPVKQITDAPGPTKTPPPAVPSADRTNEVVSSKPVEPPSHSPPETPGPYDDEMVALIDGLLAQSWEVNGAQPAAPATEGEWARRLYLRVIGRIPTAEEVTAFMQDSSPNKKERLVDGLLQQGRYVEEYAHNWSGIWTNILIGRSGGMSKSDLASRAGLQQFLRRSFQANQPYDEMVYDLLTATGAGKPGASRYNGAANFLMASMTENATLATARTAGVFLGTKLQCAQCHKHPFHDWEQSHYWELNAFFRQMKVDQRQKSPQLVDADFAGETGDIDEAEIYFERLNEKKVAAYPVFFLTGDAIETSGYVDRVNRRDELARLILQTDELSRAMVNRLWAHFFGYGFTRPIDDMGPGNPPSHPKLLNALAGGFERSGYDVRRLIRWITLSEAFSLSSRRSAGNEADDPQAEWPPLFSVYYARQLAPEQVFESLMAAAGDLESAGSVDARQRQKSQWVSQFTMSLNTDEGEETTTFNGAVPQALAMMNGPLVRRATSLQEDGVLRRVVQGPQSHAEKVKQLYLSALSRYPTRKEMEAAAWLIRSRGADPSTAFQDLWWALLNSNEFILDH